MSHERDIDRLYQLPLGEFTEARNALAKSAGKDGGGIKALEKPGAAAWAVNQLYWRERKAYDKLTKTSDRVRAAHAQILKGKSVDLSTLELQHSAAVKEAAEIVRQLLSRAGDAATPATMKSVIDTLQALPGGGEPGRLTKPLAPIGFGAFGALMQGAVSSKALAEVVTFAPPKPKADEVAAAQKRADDAAKERLRDVEARLKKLDAEMNMARVRAQRAEDARLAAEEKLQAAAAEARKLAGDVTRLESEARALERERDSLTRR